MLSFDLTSSEILDFALSILSPVLIISFAKLAIPYFSASDCSFSALFLKFSSTATALKL